MAESNDWLIRTASNEIRGPFPQRMVQKMVLEGELSSQDEICRANHFWIMLHEREEVLAHLGIEPPRQARKRTGEEITQTDTETETLVTEVDGDQSIPELEAEPDQTAMVSRATANRALREAPRSAGSTRAVKPAARVEIVGGEVERVAYWKLLAALGIVASVFLVAGAVRIIWSN